MPVGPNYNEEWLKEAVDSVLNQTVLPEEILFIDDGAELDIESFLQVRWTEQLKRKKTFVIKNYLVQVSYYVNPWRLGFSAAFNCGVGLADNDLIVYLAVDDKLMPEAIESMLNCYHEHNQKDAFYACSYEINGETHTIPINVGMVTKNFWKWYGGFPPAAFVGPDAAMHSVLMKHAPDRRIWVKDGTPLYWLREHDQQETKTHTWVYADEMLSIRSKLTENFKPDESIVLR